MLHRKLRAKMVEYDFDQQTLAAAIGCTPSYLSRRLGGKGPWTLGDVYSVCERLNISVSDIPEYFPLGGGRLTPARRPRLIKAPIDRDSA